MTRFETILFFAEKSEISADIGSDHGIVVVELLKKGIATKTIATDISDNSLEKLREKIPQLDKKISSKIEIRVGDGLKPLKKDEADQIIIAGMGGNLICKILVDYDSIFNLLSPNIILSPIQDVEILRKYLNNNKFSIKNELICFEKGKYYHVLKCAKKQNHIDAYPIDNSKRELSYLLGLQNIKRKDQVTLDYFNHLINKNKQIIKKIEKSGNKEQNLHKIAEINEMIDFLEKLVIKG